ncbi:MAG: hypothetical protein JSR47_23090 [Proteobacteria bacterium]|nr:hypothetical protein [Pseudomonadota bacterium]
MGKLDTLVTAAACLSARFIVMFLACTYARLSIGIFEHCELNVFGCALVSLASPIMLLMSFLPAGDAALRELFPGILIAALVLTIGWTALALLRRRSSLRRG